MYCTVIIQALNNTHSTDTATLSRVSATTATGVPPARRNTAACAVRRTRLAGYRAAAGASRPAIFSRQMALNGFRQQAVERRGNQVGHNRKSVKNHHQAGHHKYRYHNVPQPVQPVRQAADKLLRCAFHPTIGPPDQPAETAAR